MASSPTTTADDILACARRLITAGGYNGFSYADIAEVVGIRKPSIHHHFATKADLVQALVVRYRQEMEAGLEQLARNVADPLEQLRAYAGYWKGCIGDGSQSFCVAALLASELPVLPSEVALEVRAFFRALSAWLADVLARGRRAGRLGFAGTPAAAAEGVMATVHGAMLSARAHEDPAMFAVVVDPLLERLAQAAAPH